MSRPGGRVDTVFREYTLTAEQAVAEFGLAAVSAEVAKLAEKTPDAQVSICHAIYPRQVHMVGARMAKNLPVASCHFEVSSRKLLRESGYHETPVIVPRWAVIPATAYAIGPMFDALPDAREYNAFLELDRKNAGIQVAGLWIAEDDGVLNPRTIKVAGGRVIVASSVDSMKGLTPPGNWQFSDHRAEQYERSIRRTMMADQLQPQDGPAMTATEVHVRVGLIRQLLGPIYGRLQAEYLAPTVERCFGLLYRAGVFGTAPESLGGASLRVKYNNPLARAQRAEDVAATERLVAGATALANLGQSVPAAAAAVDRVDFDELLGVFADGLGAPKKVLRDEEALAAFREAKAEQQAQQQQAAQAQQMQTMAADAAFSRAARAA
jgi:hypothetical protein